MTKLKPQDFAASIGPGKTFAFTCEMSVSPTGAVRAKLPANVSQNEAFMAELRAAVERRRRDADNALHVDLVTPRRHTYVIDGDRKTLVTLIADATEAYAEELRHL